MPLEQELAANTAAIKENTAALLAVLAASPAGVPANVTPIKTAAPADEIEVPEKIERKAAPAAKKAKEAPADDTPSVPSKTAEPGGPAAAEHVDVDEMIAEIGQIVKDKITAAAATGEDDAVKDAWLKVREKFGVARIGELKSRPADLVKALAAAKAL